MPLDVSILDEFLEKLAALRQWVQETSPQWHSVEDYDATPVPEVEVQRFEREFVVTLPPEYRTFLTRIGAGRAWPGNVLLDAPWGLTQSSREPFPLSGPMLGLEAPDVHGLPADAEWEEYGRLLKVWDAIPKGHGVLQFCFYGCAVNAVLVLNGPFAGRVWLVAGDAAYYGPFGGAELFNGDGASSDWVPTDTPRDYPFLEWYENWLDGQMSIAIHSSQAIGTLGRFGQSDTGPRGQ